MNSKPRSLRFRKGLGYVREHDGPGKTTYSVRIQGRSAGLTIAAPLVVLKGKVITLHPTSKLTAEWARHLAFALVMAANDLERKLDPTMKPKPREEETT